MRRAGWLAMFLTCCAAVADEPDRLSGTRPLTGGDDLSKAMLDGLHRFAERKLVESPASRATRWKRDTSTREAYEKSVAANRASFHRKIGIADPRVASAMERFGDDERRGLVAEHGGFRVEQVRWPGLEAVKRAGLVA